MHKLKIDKKKKFKIEITYTAVVGSSNTPNFHLLLLANSFNFNLSFSILPNVISDNTSIPFL